MPNMFGGDQFHPAYHPHTELKYNQVMVGTDLWTIDFEGRKVSCESVDGSVVNYSILTGLKENHQFPEAVRKRYDFLFYNEIFEGNPEE